MANQANLGDMPSEKLKVLEDEFQETEEANKALVAEIKAASAGKIHYASLSLDAFASGLNMLLECRFAWGMRIICQIDTLRTCEVESRPNR